MSDAKKHADRAASIPQGKAGAAQPEVINCFEFPVDRHGIVGDDTQISHSTSLDSCGTTINRDDGSHTQIPSSPLDSPPSGSLLRAKMDASIGRPSSVPSIWLDEPIPVGTLDMFAEWTELPRPLCVLCLGFLWPPSVESMTAWVASTIERSFSPDYTADVTALIATITRRSFSPDYTSQPLANLELVDVCSTPRRGIFPGGYDLLHPLSGLIPRFRISLTTVAIALSCLARIVAMGIKIIPQTAGRLVLTSFMMAYKLAEDESLPLSWWARAGGVSPTDLFELELDLFFILDGDLIGCARCAMPRILSGSSPNAWRNVTILSSLTLEMVFCAQGQLRGWSASAPAEAAHWKQRLKSRSLHFARLTAQAPHT
jgi:Cyclin